MKSGPNVVQKWCKWGIQYLNIEICKHLVDIISEKESDIKTSCCWSHKYDLNQLWAKPQIPNVKVYVIVFGDLSYQKIF